MQIKVLRRKSIRWEYEISKISTYRTIVLKHLIQYCKFTRVVCSTNNQTVTKLNCKVKLIHRYLNYLNVDIFLPKAVRSFKFAFNVSHRTLLGGMFQYVLGFKEINGCEITKIVAGNPMLKPIIEFANLTLLRGVIRQCPYGPGSVRIQNASVELKSAIGFHGTQSMPNGEYKIDIRMYTKRDANALTLSLIMENNWRSNKITAYEKFWFSKKCLKNFKILILKREIVISKVFAN